MGKALPSIITYVCTCGNVMLVSVEKVNQKRDEFHKCDECGAEAVWDECTIDGEGDPPWTH